MTERHPVIQFLKLHRALVFSSICIAFITSQVGSFVMGTIARDISSFGSMVPQSRFDNTYLNAYQNDIVGSIFYNQMPRRDILKAVWRDSIVSLTIPASKERTYELFSSLNEHPTW